MILILARIERPEGDVIGFRTNAGDVFLPEGSTLSIPEGAKAVLSDVIPPSITRDGVEATLIPGRVKDMIVDGTPISVPQDQPLAVQ